MVALQHDDEYPMNEGRIVSTDGLSIESSEYESYFEERQVGHSTALHTVRLPQCKSYFVGPLARLNLNRERLSPTARQLSGDVGIGWPCFNPYQSIVARALEVVHAYEESLQIIADYQPFSPAKVQYEPRPGEGMAATEAPRGMIYNRYKIDEDGRVTFAKIVPPTSQNQGQIEADLRALLPGVLGDDDALTALECEKLIRSYDPCISCSTHFLKLEIQRG
jgi:coenzyme F420-reducing hydrogenase alpha subunit